jgi:hypothetical protein
MAITFRTPIRSDFVEHCPMAKPTGLHDSHVVEYHIQNAWLVHIETRKQQKHDLSGILSGA